MGVPAFFRWLSRKYPAIVVHCVEHKPASIHDVKIPIDTSQPNPNEVEFDNLYLDMNGIIHPCCHPEDKSAPKNEDEMMIAIFEYIDRIFSIVRPRKLLYMAIDGVAPRAKMNQQRSRRFRAAKETVEKSDEIKRLRVEMFSKGYYLPSQKPVEEKFDSNCITPGTPFMFRLAECLRFYIHERLNSDPGWSSIKVILSDANVPGEGEHKIMDYIRRQRAQPDHDPNTNHCLCGADADLIMLGLATHEPHFTIIREEFKPNKPKPCELCGQFGHETSECVGLPKDKCGEFDELTTPLGVEQEFIFIRLNVLREYLERELRMDGLPFVYDFERALDDWVFMCFFVGNDFLPHLPSLQIREGAIDRLVKLYKRAVYKTGGYLTNSGVVNLSRVQLIMSDLGKMEDEIFKNRRNSDLEFRKRDKERKKRMKRDIIKPAWMLGGQYAPQALGAAVPTIQKPRQTAADLRMQQKAYFSYASGRNLEQQQVADTLKSMLVNGEPGAGAAATDMQDTRGTKRKHEADDEDDEPADDIKLWEDGFKDRYYKKKFDSESDDLAFRYVVAYHYVLGLCWVLRYYYQGCPSWKWYFPYHYAPFASDFINISDIPNEFEKHTQPFKPLEQLMGVFPSASRQFLPPTWQRLMTDSDSSIIDFYPTDFKIDLNGKKFAWQGVALLPFVDETRLKAALADVYSDLTQEEIKRNIRGNDRLFVNHRHAAFNFLEGLYEGGGINQRVRIDPSLSEGMAGNVWCDDFVVLFGEVVRSPLPQLKDLNDNRVISVQFEDLRFEEDFIFPAKMLSGAKLLDRVLKPEDFERKFPGQQYRPQLGFTKNSGYRPSNPNSALRMIRSNLGGAQQMMSQLLFNQRMGEMGQQQQQQQQQYPGRTDYWQQNHQDSTRWNQGCRIPPPSSEQWQRNSHGYGYASHGNTGGYSSSAHDRSVWRQPVASSSYSSSSYGGRQPQIESYSTNSGNLAFSQQSDNRRQQYPLPPNYQSSTSSLSYRRY